MTEQDRCPPLGGLAREVPIPVSSFEEALSPAQAKKFSMVNSFHSLLAGFAGNLEARVKIKDRLTLEISRAQPGLD